MRVYTMTRTVGTETEVIRISDMSTDLFVNGVFRKTYNTIYGDAGKSAKAHYKAGYKFV